eukprot:scaffold9150_cov120-Isochrysis_galbana.AAC.23
MSMSAQGGVSLQEAVLAIPEHPRPSASAAWPAGPALASLVAAAEVAAAIANGTLKIAAVGATTSAGSSNTGSVRVAAGDAAAVVAVPVLCSP